MRTTDEYKSMSLSKRKCFYPDEDGAPVSYFPTYSESNCFLECSWERAKNLCGCSPWYLLSLFKGSSLCERLGNWCFKEAIEKRYQVHQSKINSNT